MTVDSRTDDVIMGMFCCKNFKWKIRNKFYVQIYVYVFVLLVMMRPGFVIPWPVCTLISNLFVTWTVIWCYVCVDHVFDSVHMNHEG